MFKEIKCLTFLAFCGLVVAQSRRNPYGNSDSARFTPASQARKTGAPRMTAKLARTINSFDSVEEFMNMINKGQDGPKNGFIASRFGGEERSNAIVPKPAKCTPELHTVRLDTDNDDPSVFYYPSCTRVQRCGGCCESLFSCRANETVMKNFVVVVARMTIDGDVVMEEKKIIPVEEHTRCHCECKIQAQDCHPKHEYDEENCECKCTNEDEEDKCERNSDLKYWDPTTCSCHCRQEKMCNIGWSFDPDSCRCEQDTSSVYGYPRKTDYGYPEKSNSRASFPELPPPDINNRRRSNRNEPKYKSD